VGRALLAAGRVATLLLAGGQGTRLGFPGPKGCFVLGPEPDRTLFRIHAERVAAASREAGRAVPLVVLVSEATEAGTREAFGDPASLGLVPGQVEIVRQGLLPALDEDGRALLAAEGRLATAPDGHGGALAALARAGILERLRADGVDVLTTFQVDNPLARPLDPVFLGWMVERRAQAAGKAIARHADEKVGVFARDLEGRTLVVEYSEFPEGGMPSELALGSIALHAFSVAWLADLLRGGLALPLHRAHKRVPSLDDAGRLVEPVRPNAWKFERFLFDAFPLARRVEVQEVLRGHEFAPVKNATGSDSPETARELVAAEVRRAYAERGLEPPDPPALRPLAMWEALRGT
jgi:UDP-N-acetylglucosamine/UDP-N-acetylgalactosamine diphosphorylase